MLCDTWDYRSVEKRTRLPDDPLPPLTDEEIAHWARRLARYIDEHGPQTLSALRRRFRRLKGARLDGVTQYAIAHFRVKASDVLSVGGNGCTTTFSRPRIDERAPLD